MASLKVDMDEVQRELAVLKRELLKRSKQANLKKGDWAYKYKVSKAMWAKFETNRAQRVWQNCFYCLHLYIRMALQERLHTNPARQPQFAKDSQEMLTKLKVAERELAACLTGMEHEIILRKRRELAGKRIEAEKAADTLQGQDSHGEMPPPAYAPRIYTENEINSRLNALRLDGATPAGSIFKPGQDPRAAQEAAYRREAEALGRVVDSRNMLHSEVSTNKTPPLRVQRIPGDGNCAFRAVVQGFHKGNLPPEQETRDASSLRGLVSKRLVQMRGEEMTGTGLTVEQIVLMDDDSSYSTFAEYISAMSTTKYAGATEFWILSKTLNRNISIYIADTQNGGYKELVTYGDDPKEPIRLLWKQGMTEGGNHYDLLLPS